ncbi:BREX-2 system phosphatase PglZ [Umezawaea beigongshangensis]|uniref:BREX-2 system phosphatase PglZ n=1 Tax=Umezawaea beigongshangensis TaxID=2780383 RepID=UPI0018F147E1|nr:BREX-2 system phosphatase PglZ [Umezawaea beigongshangensis]
MAVVPQVNRRIVEALLQAHLPDSRGRRLLLVHGRFDGSSPTEFKTTVGDRSLQITVTDQPSVLGIVEAWQAHRATGEDGVLVVTTVVDDRQLGWDLRAHAVGKATQTVDRVEIVKQRFGAKDVDPRIRHEPWLVDALLDAEPTGGWRRPGTVLTRDAAVRALIGARLGGAELTEGGIDAAALLAWSRTPAAAGFATLPEAERKGLVSWLEENVGDAAAVLMDLASAGRADDAMALGVLGSVAIGKGVTGEIAVAFGGLLGVRPKGNQLPAFVDAVAGTLDRWLTEVHTGGEAARRRVLEVVTRADELAESAELTEALAGNRYLRSGFRSRLRTLGTALFRHRDDAAEKALREVEEHALAELYPAQTSTASMAVRLLRWLGQPEPQVDSVAGAIRAHLGEWGWVDRALAALWAGDEIHDPVLGQTYRKVHDAVREQRDRLDEAFARRLAAWTTTASTLNPAGCLLVEDVLERVVAPLVEDHAPLVLVLDGMSSAVAVELGEQLAERGWHEASPEHGGRLGAVAAIPSVTTISRASLLTGTLAAGKQGAERDGFAAFWRRHHRQAALLHKSEIGGHAGQRLSEALVSALAGDEVVGVVLNTVDDALDHGREGDRTGWRLDDVTYLRELLDTARAYGRPVVLVSDHGHVLDRSTDGRAPTSAQGVESVRWRLGTADDGEVELAGPRVLEGGGRVVVPWREDIRYLQRRAGYHGGAALAEMTVPVLVLLPAADQALPAGWRMLSPEEVTPPWWGRRVDTTAPVSQSRTKPKSKPVAVQNCEPLFAEPSISLGAQVVERPVYDAQKQFVPKGPNKPQVAAVIDVLVEGGGTRSLTAVAAAAGRAGRNPEFLVSILQRLLNVEGYPVLTPIDGGRTLKLDVDLLREQFEVSKP